MIVAKIQMRQLGLEKFIIWKVDNRSERMGVIHDDDAINVNRKTKTLLRGTQNSGVEKPRGQEFKNGAIRNSREIVGSS
jgi:hypothetical protein